MALFGKKSVIANPNCIQFTICTIIIGRGKLNEIVTHEGKQDRITLKNTKLFLLLTFFSETQHIYVCQVVKFIQTMYDYHLKMFNGYFFSLFSFYILYSIFSGMFLSQD